MAITYTRNITNLVVKDVVVDGTTLTDAIAQVSWDYTGTNANNVSGTFSGIMSWDRNPTRYMSANNFYCICKCDRAKCLGLDRC